MKKIVLLLLIIIFPIEILAYSKYIIPGGESIGIKINTDGLVVIGFYKVDGEYIASKTIKIGDIITKVNNKKINNLNEISNIIDKDILDNNEINIELIRNNKTINTTLNIKEERGIYKTGLYVKDAVIGLGTLSYIDPESNTYGALGHEITMSENKNIVEVKNGTLLESIINGIDKSRNGYVGSKNASISYSKILGNVLKNTNKGIYGKWNTSLPNKELLEVVEFKDIKLGEAYIYTVTDNDNIEKYKINILDKYDSKKDTQKSFSFEIVDEKLLSKTGGIVQGMSGSPIIQDNKIIGCVTNVLVDNVKLGYGISIVTMLEEGEK